VTRIYIICHKFNDDNVEALDESNKWFGFLNGMPIEI